MQSSKPWYTPDESLDTIRNSDLVLVDNVVPILMRKRKYSQIDENIETTFTPLKIRR